jgi:hypothetical protein
MLGQCARRSASIPAAGALIMLELHAQQPSRAQPSARRTSRRKLVPR